jgi:hypothetical protein
MQVLARSFAEALMPTAPARDADPELEEDIPFVSDGQKDRSAHVHEYELEKDQFEPLETEPSTRYERLTPHSELASNFAQLSWVAFGAHCTVLQLL